MGVYTCASCTRESAQYRANNRTPVLTAIESKRARSFRLEPTSSAAIRQDFEHETRRRFQGQGRPPSTKEMLAPRCSRDNTGFASLTPPLWRFSFCKVHVHAQGLAAHGLRNLGLQFTATLKSWLLPNLGLFQRPLWSSRWPFAFAEMQATAKLEWMHMTVLCPMRTGPDLGGALFSQLGSSVVLLMH